MAKIAVSIADALNTALEALPFPKGYTLESLLRPLFGPEPEGVPNDVRYLNLMRAFANGSMNTVLAGHNVVPESELIALRASVMASNAHPANLAPTAAPAPAPGSRGSGVPGRPASQWSDANPSPEAVAAGRSQSEQ